MRVHLDPGPYTVKIEGSSTPLVVTPTGAVSIISVFGVSIEMAWEWAEIGGGPVLAPVGGIAVHFIGFNDDGTVDLVLPDGSGKSGTYEPA